MAQRTGSRSRSIECVRLVWQQHGFCFRSPVMFVCFRFGDQRPTRARGASANDRQEISMSLRRSVSFVLACFAAVACEDGPNQRYSPPPPGAEKKLNDSAEKGFGENQKKDFGSVGGSGEQERAV
jgi:hypothetical protein